MRRFFWTSRCRSGRAVGMQGPGARARTRKRGSTAGRIAALGIMVAGFGCAGAGDTGPFTGQQQEDARINIEVVNHGFEEITIHALWLGQRRRLGMVGGTRTADFILPWSWTDELQIRIEVLAGPECTTRPIMTSPGDHILLEVQQYLRYCGL